MAIRLVEKCVDQGIHSRGDISHPDKDVNECMEMCVAVLADSDQHVGDEEWTPHDQEEEEDNPQDFGGSLLIFYSLHHASFTLVLWTSKQTFVDWKCELLGGGLTAEQTCAAYLSGRMFGVLALLREGRAVLLEITESEVIADHHDDQRTEEGHG